MVIAGRWVFLMSQVPLSRRSSGIGGTKSQSEPCTRFPPQLINTRLQAHTIGSNNAPGITLRQRYGLGVQGPSMGVTRSKGLPGGLPGRREKPRPGRAAPSWTAGGPAEQQGFMAGQLNIVQYEASNSDIHSVNIWDVELSYPQILVATTATIGHVRHRKVLS